MPDYSSFLGSLAAKAWKNIGVRRRAGVLAPLFSIWSEKSIGVGEFPDLVPLADWCKDCRMSLIQLLPLNDVGDRFCPYDAESSFALEPMYLSLTGLMEVPSGKYTAEIAALRKKFPADSMRYDTRIKGEKLEFLRKVFAGLAKKRPKAFDAYREENRRWLASYALFKVLKTRMNGLAWEAWPESLRHREKEQILRVQKENKGEIEFHEWTQWQLFRQFKDTAAKLRKKNVLLLGDLPFLVARDSADVWAHPEFFKLELSAGAPPDLYFAEGQEWGMPPYHWAAMAVSGCDTMKEKMRYAANFYDLFRMDHFVGLFRVWVFPRDGSVDRKKRAAFDPPDEAAWDAQARMILDVMLDKNPMLPCAEDLGTVPDQAKNVLREYAIPGMEVQRWMRDWEGSVDFRPPESYRAYSIATISTHDMSSFENWWMFEAGTAEESFVRRTLADKGLSYEDEAPKLFESAVPVHGRLRWKSLVRDAAQLPQLLGRGPEEMWELMDLFRKTADEKERFWGFLGFQGKPDPEPSREVIERALEKAAQSASIFSIQSVQDLLALDNVFGPVRWETRFNQPGIMDKRNWRLRAPISLEKMRRLKGKESIRKMHERTERS